MRAREGLVGLLLVATVLIGAPALALLAVGEGWDLWLFVGIGVVCTLAAADAYFDRRATIRMRTIVRNYE
jgi:hypothetical protein